MNDPLTEYEFEEFLANAPYPHCETDCLQIVLSYFLGVWLIFNKNWLTNLMIWWFDNDYESERPATIKSESKTKNDTWNIQ